MGKKLNNNLDKKNVKNIRIKVNKLYIELVCVHEVCNI